MNIVFDTNVIFNDWYLKSPNISLLENFLKLSNSTLFIPKIVIEESINKYKEVITKKVLDVKGLNGMLPSSVEKINDLDIDDIVKNYAQEFSVRLTELNVKQPGYYKIPHEKIVARDLSRKRPFQNSGKGYRDSLLWESILNEIASKKTKTFLISNNHTDFCNKDSKNLHDNLKEDLEEIGLQDDNVDICLNLDGFLDDFVKPDLKSLKEAIPELIEGFHGDFEIYNWFDENKDLFRDSIQYSISNSNFELRDFEDISVTFLEYPDEIKIHDVYELNIDHVYIEADVLVDIVLDIFIFKSDFVWLNEKYDLQVWDNDWNKHYIYATTVLKLPLSLKLELNIKNDIVNDFEISIGEYFGFCRNCAKPILSDSAENCSYCGASFY